MGYERVVLANRILCAVGSQDSVDRSKLEESCVSAASMLGGFVNFPYYGSFYGALQDLRWSVYRSCIAGAYAEMQLSDEAFGGVVAHWTVGITRSASGWDVVLTHFEADWDYLGSAGCTYIGNILREIGVPVKDGEYFEAWNGPVYLLV